MTAFHELGLRNRRAIPWESVPLKSLGDLRDTLVRATAEGWRLASLFGLPDGGGHDQTRLVAILADDIGGELGATRKTRSSACASDAASHSPASSGMRSGVMRPKPFASLKKRTTPVTVAMFDFLSGNEKGPVARAFSSVFTLNPMIQAWDALAQELRARSLRPVRLVGAPVVRRPIVALRRKDAGPPIGPVAGFLETLRDARL